VRLLYLNFLKL